MSQTNRANHQSVLIIVIQGAFREHSGNSFIIIIIVEENAAEENAGTQQGGA
jgi:hypothetical protein